MKKIQVKVKPSARVSSLEETGDGVWLTRLRAPPVDGKANDELVALIAHTFSAANRPCQSRAEHLGA